MGVVMGVLDKAGEPHPCWRSAVACPFFPWKSWMTGTVVSHQDPKTRNLPPGPRWPGRVCPQFLCSQELFARSSNGAGARWSAWLCGMVC